MELKAILTMLRASLVEIKEEEFFFESFVGEEKAEMPAYSKNNGSECNFPIIFM